MILKRCASRWWESPRKCLSAMANHKETEMDSKGISRRKFLHSAGLAAAALAASGVAEHASASAADSTAVSDYDGYDGLGLAALVSKRQVSAQELFDTARQR